jgi:hypothetical protein
MSSLSPRAMDSEMSELIALRREVEVLRDAKNCSTNGATAVKPAEQAKTATAK